MKFLIAVLLLASVSQAQSFPTSTKIELGLIGGTFAFDGYSTRAISSVAGKNAEGNPILRPLATSTPGTSLYFASGFAGMIFLNHKLRNHPAIRHTVNWSTIGVEIFLAHGNMRYAHDVKRCESIWVTKGVIVSPCR